MRKGRPKGSKNKDTTMVSVLRIPATCPNCGSQDIMRRPGAQTRELDRGGEHQGIQYEMIRWTPSQCRKCGQCVTVRELIGAVPDELD